MYELYVGARASARHLFDSLDHHLAVRGILEGTVAARVYADHPTHPRSVFAWTGHRLFLAGSAENDEFNEDMRRFIATTVYPQASNVGNHMFILYYAPGDRESTIKWILDGKCPIRDERLYFETKGRRTDGCAPLPDGYALRWVDEALLKEERLRNLDELREEMCSERASVDDFLAKSFGVCLVRADEIVGWCLSEYNAADRCEVGIATAEGHRRQGLATAMACALVERAIRKGIERIGWHCWANNLPSAATALRAGFEKVADYPVFFAWFDEAENQAVNGDVRLRRGEYANALPWFEQAFSRGFLGGWAYFGAACAAARLGDYDGSLRYLSAAIEHGFTCSEVIQTSEHLAALHDTSEWSAIMKRLLSP